MVANVTVGDAKEIYDRVDDNAQAQGISRDSQVYQDLISKELQSAMILGKIGGAVAVGLADRDVGVGLDVASNTLEHSFLPMMVDRIQQMAPAPQSYQESPTPRFVEIEDEDFDQPQATGKGRASEAEQSPMDRRDAVREEENVTWGQSQVQGFGQTVPLFDRPSEEVLRERARHLDIRRDIAYYDSKEECLESWKNTLYPDRPPSPRTERRFMDEWGKTYERLRTTVSFGSDRHSINLEESYAQGKEHYIQERMAEFAQGRGNLSEGERQKLRQAAENHYRHHEEQQLNGLVGGALGFVGQRGMRPSAPSHNPSVVAPKVSQVGKAANRNMSFGRSTVKTTEKTVANSNDLQMQKTGTASGTDFVSSLGSVSVDVGPSVSSKSVNTGGRKGSSLNPVNSSRRDIEGLDLAGIPQKPKLTKPLKEISNAELVQEIANRAEYRVGGKGAVPGTHKHTYAKRLLDKTQKLHGDRGLETEQRWANGDVWQPGIPLKGSVKLDVYDKNVRVVYDHKFVQQPGSGLKQSQINRIQEQVGTNVPVIEVNPNLIKK